MKKALHQEIADSLRRQILSGACAEDGRLPDEKTLAAQFGVSRTTISRVMLDLKACGLIVTRAGTPARVSRFAQNAAGMLGVIDPGEARGSVLSEICYQVERLGKRFGWEVVRETLKESSPEARAAEAQDIATKFAESRVSGVILQPLEFQKNSVHANQSVLSSFENRGMPVVLLDYDIVSSPDRSKYDLVSIDNVAAGQAVASRLIKEGCRRLCFLMPPRAPASLTERLHGVASAVLDFGQSWSHARNVLVAGLAEHRSIASFLRKHRPDAVICGNDVSALSLLSLLNGGMRLAVRPRVGGFDGLPSAVREGVVTVRQPCKSLATVAMLTMLSRIKNPNLPPRTVRLIPEVVASGR